MPVWNLVRAAALLAIVGAPAIATPVQAQIQAGDPCGPGNPNACQSGSGTPASDHAPVADRSAYVTQIGDSNAIVIDQTAPISFASVDQSGDRNQADIRQQGPRLAYADLSQLGSDNFASITQSGVTSGNVVLLSQNGMRNGAVVQQTGSGAVENGAILTQLGNDNSIALDQSGSDNQALLTQLGDGNVMTASQVGSGNRLEWTQQGNNLSSLAIAQTGGQTIQVTQTK